MKTPGAGANGATEEFPLDKAVGFMRAIWALNHALERTSMRMERTLGVTAQQRMLLRVVGKFPGITSGKLAQVLNVDAATVSIAIKRLELRALLERRRDRRDARRVALGLTEAGHQLTLAHPGTVERAVERLISSTSADEMAAVSRVLGRLCSLLDEQDEPEAGR